jgi:hypothetical protein
VALLAVGAGGVPLEADRALNGPGRPVPAPAGRTDAELLERAMRLQARMPAHLSPEGLLAYEHRVGASPEQLSEDVLKLSDAAIWTGCYAAAQACRWHVTRDPLALEELRRLVHGLHMLERASGREGGLVRNVGRPLPGSSGFEKSEPSPMGEGMWCRGDVSRDQLAGVTLGWAAIGRFVEDATLKEAARSHLAALARRLRADRMWLRDLRGRKTDYGELREDVEGIPFTKNGRHAAIGLAPVVAAVALDPAPDLADHLRRLLDDGWGRALPEQFAWLPPLQSPSSVNMGYLALLTCRLMDRGIVAAKALEGLGRLRAATRGWWNGGYCACLLLGGLQHRRAEVVDELRAVLHLMTEDEVPYAQQTTRHVSFIPTIVQRGNTHWTWKDQLGLVREQPAPGSPRSAVTYTRADWLFAYWLARAGGALDPGAGAAAPAR